MSAISGLEGLIRRWLGLGRSALGEVPVNQVPLARWAACTPQEALAMAASSAEGLTENEAAARLRLHGPNDVAHAAQQSILTELVTRSVNPLNVLLLTLAIVSYSLGDRRAAIVIAVMAVDRARVYSGTSIDEIRRSAAPHGPEQGNRVPQGEGTHGEPRDIPMSQVVPGDIVLLSAGDMISADVRLLSAKDLFVNQSALTGEAMPLENTAQAGAGQPQTPSDLPNICFMDSAVVSGAGRGVVVQTGSRTSFGEVADLITGARVLTAFDKGITRFTWMMLCLIAVMVPLVFLINGLSKGNWFEALLFAVAVAVGLTPEMLPMIVTVNLAKGAMAMSKKKVIVKRLNAIQNFGAMDVLCTDKTGTLTQDQIILKRHLDLRGEELARVLEYAYLNSFHQSGLKNLLDVAVLRHAELEEKLRASEHFTKIDEIPFDFERRRMSVVLERGDGAHVLICKGAIEEVFAVCTNCEIDGNVIALDKSHLVQANEEAAALNADGFRVVAVSNT